MKQEHARLDLERFNSPLARAVLWTPHSYGGFRLRTCRLVRVGARRIEFRACAKMYVIGAGMILGGLFALVTSVLRSGGFDVGVLFAVVFSAAFAGGGGLVLVLCTRPVTFDMGMGCFWHGRTPPAPSTRDSATPHQAPLNRIKAIQLLAEACSHKNGSYPSYELNIVLDDASRHTVLDHGILKQVRKDAAELAAFIGVPVWDAIDPPPDSTAA